MTSRETIRGKCPSTEFFPVRFGPEKNSVFGHFSRCEKLTNFKLIITKICDKNFLQSVTVLQSEKKFITNCDKS